MKTKRIRLSLLFASILAFSGCGGGGGSGTTSTGGGSTTDSSSGGIGGTGISSGVLTGFGSVFVNGVEFETNASSFLVDDSSSTEDGLQIGMVVKVDGTVNDDGVTGTATSVSFNADLKGPVATLPTVNPDNTEVSFILLNRPVIISEADTSFSNTTLNGLVQGDMVEVSGFYDSNGNLRATYLEKKSTSFVANATQVEIKGTVASVNGSNQFLLVNGPSVIQVNFSGATDLSGLPNGVVANGLFVEVKGTIGVANASLITATQIQNEGYEANQEDVGIQGLVTDYVSISSFKVAGVAVNGANAELEPSNLSVVEGANIEAEGNIVNGLLIATKLQGRDGSIEAQANVSATNTTNGSITLSLHGAPLVVLTDTATRFEDNLSEIPGFGVSNISSGDFLLVQAYEDAAGHLIASRVQREGQSDDRLKGPVDSANQATNSLTILGVSFSTLGADFQNSDDSVSNAGDFYATVQVGALVRVTDNAAADGIANDVEFELEDEQEYDDVEDDD